MTTSWMLRVSSTAVLCVSIVTSVTVVRGQEAETEERSRLGVEIIRDSDPRTGSEILHAVRNLLNLNEPTLAKEFLGRWTGLELTDRERKALVDEFGSAFIVRLATESALAPEGRAIATELFAANRRLVRDPEGVAKRVADLASEDEAARSAARRALREAGPVAAIPLLQAIVRSDIDHRGEYLRALVGLGSDAQSPLLAALDSEDPALRQAALDALTFNGDRRVLPYAAALLHGDDSVEVRDAAAKLLRRRVGLIPSRDEAIVQIRDEIKSLLVDEDLPLAAEDDAAGTMIWKWDRATESATMQSAVSPVDIYFSAKQLGEWLHRLSPSAAGDRYWYVASQLTYDATKNVEHLPLEKSSPELYAELASWPSNDLEAILDDMLSDQLHIAAAGVIEVLGGAEADNLVRGVGGKPRPLARALGSSDRRVAFEAARAIMRLDPAGPYPGAADLVELAGYLARTEGSPRVLIIHARLDHSGDIAGWLQNMGYQVDQTTTARRAELMAGGHPDYELILLSDRVGGASWYELYQRLRRQPRVAQIPLAILVRPENSNAAETQAVADPFAITYPFPYDEVTVQSIVRRATALQRFRPISVEERLRQASEAIQWLERMSGDRQRYRSYEVLPWQETLLNAMQVPTLARPAMRALARLGTPKAQWGLVEFASRSSESIADRQAAANAFHFAVAHQGLQLSPTQIRCQYDRHRAEIGFDEEAEQVLHQIVEIIEGP